MGTAGKLPHHHHKPAPIPQNHSPVDCLTASKRWSREGAHSGPTLSHGSSDHLFNCPRAKKHKSWLSMEKPEVRLEAVKGTPSTVKTNANMLKKTHFLQWIFPSHILTARRSPRRVLCSPTKPCQSQSELQRSDTANCTCKLFVQPPASDK